MATRRYVQFSSTKSEEAERRALHLRVITSGLAAEEFYEVVQRSWLPDRIKDELLDEDAQMRRNAEGRMEILGRMDRANAGAAFLDEYLLQMRAPDRGLDPLDLHFQRVDDKVEAGLAMQFQWIEIPFARRHGLLRTPDSQLKRGVLADDFRDGAPIRFRLRYVQSQYSRESMSVLSDNRDEAAQFRHLRLIEDAR